MANECIVLATRELERHGLTYMLTDRAKHKEIVWLQGGKNHRYILPSTPSDWRSAYNCRADIRRMLRSAGITVQDDGPDGADSDGISLAVSAGDVLCSSRQVAAHFGKPHKDILRAIDGIRENTPEEFNQRNFAPVGYEDAKGEVRRSFDMTRDGFSLLVMGFTGADAMRWKLTYIDAFNRMEREIANVRNQAETAGLRQEVVRLRSDLDALTELFLTDGRDKPELKKPSREWLTSKQAISAYWRGRR